MVEARDVITEAIPCNIVYGRPQAADAIIRALTAAGYRIIGTDSSSEPELRAEIVRLTRERDEARGWAKDWHSICQTIATVLSLGEPEGKTFAQEAVTAISALEALSAEVGKLTEALERIDALDEASGHEMAVRHAFGAVGIARTALGEAK